MKKRILARILAVAIATTVIFMPSNCVWAEKSDTIIKNDETGIPDENLYDALLFWDTNEDGLLSFDEAENVTILTAQQRGITNLQGIEYCTNLKTLNLNINEIKNIESLKNLTNLTELYLSDNQIENIDSLEKLVNIKELIISDNKISDITVLEKLIGLECFYASSNEISDVKALSNLTKLKEVDLRFNKISDFSPLDGKNLEILKIENQDVDVPNQPVGVIKNDETGIPDVNLYNFLVSVADSNADNILTLIELEMITALDAADSEISDLKGLEYCKNLERLDLSNNNITTIEELKELSNLTVLYIERNELSDITVLGDLTNLVLLDVIGLNLEDLSALSKLVNLKTLWFDNNNVVDITPVAGLKNLVDLQFGGNKVTDISCLSQLANLETLNIRENQISNIDVVANFKELTKFYMFANQISDISPIKELIGLTELDISNNEVCDISSLKNLNNLVFLDLSGNKISDFSVLEGKDIETLIIDDQRSEETEIPSEPEVPSEPQTPNQPEVPSEPEIPNKPEIPSVPESPSAEGAIYDIKENPIITAEEFEEVLEINKKQNVVIQVGNNISIIFEKGTMNPVEGMNQYDFTTGIESNYKQAEIPSTIQPINFIAKVVFNYSGQLPAEASIRIPVGVQHAGKTLYYTLLKDDGTFGTAQNIVADTEGYITVKQAHCSSYVITTEKPSVVMGSPNTGNNFSAIWMLMFIIGISMSISLVGKKFNNK